MQQQYDRLTDNEIALILKFWGKFQSRILISDRKQPKRVLDNFSVLNNVTDTIIRLGIDLETVETCLEKCDSGNGITKVERSTIKQIENQFLCTKEQPISLRLKHLKGKLQKNLEAIYRLYASAYPR